jgi:mono/diheme cytochrome c family protein
VRVWCAAHAPIDCMSSSASPRNLPLSLLGLSLAAVYMGGAIWLLSGYAPKRPTLRYALSETTRTDHADDPAGQDQIRGALDALFGSPANPAFAVVEEWVDEEYNPNWAIDTEFSDERRAELVAANERAFAAQIAHIEAGAFERVQPPREALDLQARWREDFLAEHTELRAKQARGEAGEAEVAAYVAEQRADARALFADWYPSLRESAELYRQQCLHCHGVEGGGDGSTARFLNPRPRDYRQGKFKWTALDNKARPRRADLYRVIEEGIHGTAMPSSKRFSATQIEGLVDYVRLLAIRGETEILLALDYESDVGLPLELVQQSYLDVWEKWKKGAEEVIAYEGEVPRATPERIAHGRALFTDPATANCIKCHGMSGRGDGESAYEVNAQGVRVPVKDDWGNEILPRDLSSGLYRGGSRPIDIYRRLYAGINGTPMPSHSTLMGPDGQRLISDDDLWDIVHYVRSLSAPSQP